MFRPMASSNGRYLANVVASPPTMMVMPGGRPLTGESRNSTPRVRQTSATRRTTLGALVVMSMQAPPALSPARIPVDGSTIALSTSAGPGSDVKTTSLVCAVASGVSAQRAPRSHRLEVASRRRSWTVTRWPASMRQRAIGLPIVPVPTKPSCIRESPSSRPERREALVRVEDVRLDPRRLVGLAPELGHGPRQTHPVEELLLAALLDRGQRRLAPGRPVASLERRVQDAVGRDIRIEEVVLARQERVGPARRGDERDTPGAPCQGAGARGAEVEAAPGHRRGRVELIAGRRLGEACDAGSLRDHLSPVAVDLDRHPPVA